MMILYFLKARISKYWLFEDWKDQRLSQVQRNGYDFRIIFFVNFELNIDKNVARIVKMGRKLRQGPQRNGT